MRGASRRPQTGLASSSFKSQLASPSFRSQLLFFKITKNPSPSLPGMTSFTSQSHFPSGVFIMTSVIVTSSAHEREQHSMCTPARALSQIVLSLTKPNDKIKPTKNDNIKKKSFCNYITVAIEKEAFESPSITVANFSYFYLYINI